MNFLEAMQAVFQGAKIERNRGNIRFNTIKLPSLPKDRNILELEFTFKLSKDDIFANDWKTSDKPIEA